MKLILASLSISSLALAQPGPPAPSPDVTATVKANAGTWTCTGSLWMPDNKPYPVTATLVVKSDLADFWVHETFTGKITLGGFTFETYSTSNGKQWQRYVMSSIGGYANGTSNDGKTFELAGSDPFGSYKLRDRETLEKGVLHKSGERSLDGKTWVHDYDVTCKR